MKINFKLKSILKIISLAVFALIFGAFAVMRGFFASSEVLNAQYARQRWESGDLKYAQISVFLPPSSEFSINRIRAFNSTLEKKLQESSIKVDENAQLYTYAYSAEGNITVSNDRTGVNTAVTAVGGNYFYFHNMKVLSGYYFSDDEITHDRIVIDNVLAWQMFGSYDIEGLTVRINNVPYTIAAVVEREWNDVYNSAYGEKPRIYMSYDSYSVQIGKAPPITSYEMLVPNPITGFGMKLIKDNLGITDIGVTYVENSSRFDTMTLWNNLKTFTNRSMRTNSVVYPYWENCAVVAADKCTLAFLGQVISAGLFFILLIIYIIIFIRGHKLNKEIIVDGAQNKFSEIQNKIKQHRLRRKNEDEKQI